MPIPRAELASADGPSNLCRGPVMRVDRVLDISAVATRGARMMPGAFEDASKVFEDATLRARDIFGIFERRVPTSGAVLRLRARRANFVRRAIGTRRGQINDVRS